MTKNKFPLVLLGIGSLVCSRGIFMLIDDPEGPNLLIVIGLAVVIFIIVLLIIKVFMRWF